MFSEAHCRRRCHLVLVSATALEPPADIVLPADAAWAVPAGATGPFAGHEGMIATCVPADAVPDVEPPPPPSFAYAPLVAGTIAYIRDQARFAVWTGVDWQSAVPGGPSAVPIFLRFGSRAEALSALAEAGLVPPDQEVEAFAVFAAGARLCDIELVGTLSLPTGAVIEGADGEQIELRAPVAGYHVNLSWWGDEADAPDFGAAVVSPAAPSITFAE